MGAELPRRIVHASGAVIPLSYLLVGVPWNMVVAVFVIGAGVTAILEVVRLRVGLDWVVYDRLTREYEQEIVAGYAYYVVGGTVTVLLFSPEIAVPALFMLMLVDPVSGWLGNSSPGGRKRFRVLVVTFVLSFMIAYPFTSVVPALAGGVVVALADGMKPVIAGRIIDDNLTIPIGGGTAMWLSELIVPL